MPATLHCTPGSGNSLKPALVGRDAGLGRVPKRIDVLAGKNRKPDFLVINPRGQLPFRVTAHGQARGESNAIAWYLAEGTSLRPELPLQRAQAVPWMIFQQTALAPFISPARSFTHILKDPREARAADIAGGQAGAAPRVQAALQVPPFSELLPA